MAFLSLVIAGPRKKELRDLKNKLDRPPSPLGGARGNSPVGLDLGRSDGGGKKPIKHVFQNCGNFTTNFGTLESEHPYRFGFKMACILSCTSLCYHMHFRRFKYLTLERI